MIRVILADDERWVLHSIRAALSGLTDLCVIEEASDGFEALKLCCELCPDILLTDIRMPGLSGLELIRQLNSASPGTKSIIVSGYNDFELAKQAIGLNAFDYILKPIDEEELRASVTRAAQLLSLEKERLLRVNTQNERLLFALRRQFWLEVWQRRFTRTEALSHAAMEVGLLLTGKQLNVILLSAEYSGQERGQFAYPEIEPPLEYLYELFPPPCECFFVKRDESNAEYAVLLLCESGSETPCAAIESLLSFLQRMHGLKFVAGVSDFAPLGGDLPKSTARQFEKAYEAYDLSFFSRNALSLASAPNHPATEHFSVSDEITMRLFFALKMNKLEKAAEIIEELKTAVYSGGRTYLASEVKAEIWRVINDLVSMLDHPELTVGSLYTKDSLSTHACFFRCRSFSSVLSFLRGLCECMVFMETEPVDSILLAQKYVQEHYNADINLSLIAKSVYFSTAYFSNLFKRRTGMNFIDYVTQIRMVKARELLHDPSLRCYEICEQVGYTDPKYFTKLFKKHFLIGPKEYQDQVLGKQTEERKR